MSIYKGLLMLGGYLTQVEHAEVASRSDCPQVPGGRPAGGARVASRRAAPAQEPVLDAPGLAAGGCC